MIEIPKPIQPAYLREVIRDQHIVTPSKMPFVWTSLDTRNAIIASIVPTSIGIAHILSSRPHQPYFRFLESANKPKWGDFPPWLCGAIDFLTIAPLGYASYLIYKNLTKIDMVTEFFWTPIDTRNTAIATLFPTGLGLAHYMSTRPDNAYYNFYKSSVKPIWADIDPSIYGLIDLLALTPMGYATYLVYKTGGGFKFRNTTIALTIYASHAFFFGMCFPLYEKRNYKMLAINKGMTFLASLGTLFSYYQINDTAGMISIPFAITQGFSFYLSYKLYQLNDKRKKN